MRLPPVKISRPRKPRTELPAPLRPRLDTGNEAELPTGQVNGMKASMPEERMARALARFGAPFEFRYTIGAPRGMPGWKEIDFLVPAGGQVYAFEVDTSFTHREKGRADVLHDAIVLQELAKEGLSVFPQVMHVDGESDLVDRKSAERYVKSKLPINVPFNVEPSQSEDVPTVRVQEPRRPTPAQVEQKAVQPLSDYRQKVISRKRRKL